MIIYLLWASVSFQTASKLTKKYNDGSSYVYSCIETSEFLYWLPHNFIVSKLYSLYLLKTVYMKCCSHQTQTVPSEQPYPSAQQTPILNAPFTAVALTI